MSDKLATGSDGELTAFGLLLEAFGGDPSRWPPVRRAGAEALLARDDATGIEARRLAAEARALDRLLDVAASAPAPARALAGLADRIMAQTAGLPPRPAEVVPLSPARRQGVATGIATRGSPVTITGNRWAAAAVLAASLLVGIAVGPVASGLPALYEAADVFGLGGYVEQASLGVGVDIGLQDEDLL